MATLTFELTARRFVYDRGSDYSQLRLFFQAAPTPREELNVLNKGLLRIGDVTFTTEPHGSLIATLKYLDAWEDTDNGVTHQHSFALAAILGDEVFESLKAVDLSVNRVYLTFNTDLFGSGLTYGYNPDGSAKVWDLEKEDPLKAESFTIVIKTKDESEEETSEFELEERLPQPPTAVTDPQLLKQLNAIWWAIVILGSLILIRLSW